MPIRMAVASDAAGIIACVNQTWAYLRQRSAIAPVLSNWTIATLQGFQAAGYEAAVYANSNANGRIDGVVIFGVENHTRAPDVTPQPWVSIKVLAIRVNSIADTDGAHERLTMLPLKVVVPRAVSNYGAVGICMQYQANWNRLHNFLATFSMAQFEPGGDGTEWCWARLRPGIPEFTARAATVTE